MNYYERIQKSIDYIEDKLKEDIEIEKAAQEAFMSCSNYYRMFFALTGHEVKEYVRHRRISNAVTDIKETDESILAIALNYGFEIFHIALSIPTVDCRITIQIMDIAVIECSSPLKP